MDDHATICFRTKPGFHEGFITLLGTDCERWAPVAGPDGLCRLQRVEQVCTQTPAGLPCLSLKKLLLPDNEQVWSWDGRTFLSPDTISPRAVFGVAYCDLQALWYLDQVFAEDTLYLKRRQRLLVVGATCSPEDHCACLPAQMPIAGDMFWSESKVWGLSARGKALLEGLAAVLGDPGDDPVPVPEGVSRGQSHVDEALFRKSASLPIWQEQAKGCLSCGTCSAVCPTCYCYDMIDRVSSEGGVTRQRAWDNCFFADHAEVAGGHDFRPGRAERLRFRFEHKKLGFGPLRGKSSCVGCGRCLTGCPAGIDLEQIAEQLTGAVSL